MAKHAARPTVRTRVLTALAAVLAPFTLHEDVVKAAAK